MIAPRLILGVILAAAISGCTVTLEQPKPEPQVTNQQQDELHRKLEELVKVTVEQHIVEPEPPKVIIEKEKVYINKICELPSLEKLYHIKAPDKIKYRYMAEANPNGAKKEYIRELKSYAETTSLAIENITREYETCLKLRDK